MKRVILICIIISLCVVVAISGNIALVNSNGVLKKHKKIVDLNVKYHIMIDISDKRLFLLKDNVIENSFSAAVGNIENPSPIGNWKAAKILRDKNGKKEYWIALNVPWGKYAIYGTDYHNSKICVEGSVKLFEDDFAEVYNKIEEGASVYIYGGLEEQVYKSIKPGDRGAMVYEVEKRLRVLGYDVGKVDGIYDKALKQAIHQFQKSHRLKESNAIEYPFFKKLGVVILE